MTCFRSAALAAFAACALVSASAEAAVEAHETARDVRISVDAGGVAHIDETLHFRLLYPGWKGVDLPNVELDAAPEGQATLTSIEGGSAGANLTVLSPGTLRLDALDPKGLKKGDYAAHFSYRADFVAGHQLVKDGALWRVTWTSPAPLEGVDGMRVVFDFPAAPTEPAAVDLGDTGGPEFLATLRRSEDKDEIELVRPHVARGEAATWSVRLDPKALSSVRDPVLRPPPAPRVAQPEDPFASTGAPWRALIASLLGLAFLFAGVLRLRGNPAKIPSKSMLFVSPRISLLPAAIAYGVGVWLELAASQKMAMACFAVAALGGAVRAAPGKPSPRGPGSWKTIPDHQALAQRPSFFDLGSLRGIASLTSVIASTCIACVALRRVDPDAWLAVVPAALPWLVFWLSGNRSSFGDVGAAARVLRPIFLILRRGGARVTAWGRIPTGRRDMDDLRLLVVPDTALPGLVGIEVAVGWLGLIGGFSPRLEVFVRARDASAAAAKMGSLSKRVRACTGRRAEERVYVLEPRDGAAEDIVDLVLKSAAWLVDRRLVAENEWAGAERRTLRGSSGPRTLNGARAA